MLHLSVSLINFRAVVSAVDFTGVCDFVSALCKSVFSCLWVIAVLVFVLVQGSAVTLPATVLTTNQSYLPAEVQPMRALLLGT